MDDISCIACGGSNLEATGLLAERRWPLWNCQDCGLSLLEIDAEDRDLYLDVIKRRVRHACTGANWQRAYVTRHACSMQALTEAYYERQQSGLPVHDWSS